MTLTHHPNGVSSFGMPMLGSADFSVPESGGSVWFVLQDASGGGTGPDDCYGTIAQAITRARTGDTILVYPGSYDENLTVSTDGITIAAALKGGYNRPDIVPTTGTALTVTTGQGFYARGVRFYSADSDTVVHNANGAVYEDCVFDGDSGQASTETNLRLVPSATDDSYSASENRFVGCLFRLSTGSGVTFQHALAAGGGEGTSDNQFLGCTFVGNTVSDLISKVNTNGGGAGIYLRLLVNGCNFLTTGASYKYINLSAGAAGDLTANSGLISGNWFGDEALTGGTGNQIDLGGQGKVMFTGNFDAAGIVNGTTFNN